MPIMQFMAVCCFFAGLESKIIILINASTLTTGDLSSMIAYTMNILNCLMMLLQVLVMINMARASCERIIEVSDEKVL